MVQEGERRNMLQLLVGADSRTIDVDGPQVLLIETRSLLGGPLTVLPMVFWLSTEDLWLWDLHLNNLLHLLLVLLLH